MAKLERGLFITQGQWERIGEGKILEVNRDGKSIPIGLKNNGKIKIITEIMRLKKLLKDQ